MNKIYLAGSISGLSYEEVTKYFITFGKRLKDLGYDVYNPMTGKAYLRNEVKFKSTNISDNPISTNHAIYERDKWMVQHVDIVLANLENSPSVSIGTMHEIAWASLLGKHVIGVIPKGGLHDHAFVLESCDIIFQTLEEAVDYLERLAIRE